MTDKDYLARYLGTQTQHKYLCVKLTWLENMENYIVDESTLSTIHDDSDDTELYELEERTIGTLTYIENTEVLPSNGKELKTVKNSTKGKDSRMLHNKNLKFNCSITECKIYAKSQKEIDQHYKTIHISMSYL